MDRLNSIDNFKQLKHYGSSAQHRKRPTRAEYPSALR